MVASTCAGTQAFPYRQILRDLSAQNFQFVRGFQVFCNYPKSVTQLIEIMECFRQNQRVARLHQDTFVSPTIAPVGPKGDFMHIILIVFLGLMSWTAGCTNSGSSSEETVKNDDDQKPNPELFRCEASPGSYHQLIIIEQEEADDEGGDEDKLVRILFGASDLGQFGRCRQQPNPSGKGTYFFCRSSSQSMRMTWPSAATKTPTMVDVEEDWLFGVRRYKTNCKPVR